MTAISKDVARRNALIGYALALGLIAAVLVLRLVVPASVGSAPVYLFLIPALLVISAVGGFGPGCLRPV